MGNAVDYINWRGDLSFDAAPVNELDVFIFSQIIAPDFRGLIEKDGSSVTLKEVADKYFESHSEEKKNLGLLQSEFVLPSLKAMSKSVRYKDLLLSRYVHKIKTATSEQFCGLSIECPGNFLSVIFQGTDDTIIGWKEDFELAARETVASHLDAVRYLNKAVRRSDAEKVFVSGHSKGGNLAIYSAVNADKDVRDRITTAISFDGPGFRDTFFDSENYIEMKKRLVTVLSDYSFVGLMLKLAGRRVIVKSSVSGPMAHDGFNWEAMGTKFVKTPRLSHRSQKFDRVIDDLLTNYNEKDRLKLTDEIFSILLSTGAVTVTDLTELHLKDKAALFQKLSQNPVVGSFIKLLFNSILNS